MAETVLITGASSRFGKETGKLFLMKTDGTSLQPNSIILLPDTETDLAQFVQV